jgi:hypothetical protein
MGTKDEGRDKNEDDERDRPEPATLQYLIGGFLFMPTTTVSLNSLLVFQPDPTVWNAGANTDCSGHMPATAQPSAPTTPRSADAAFPSLFEPFGTLGAHKIWPVVHSASSPECFSLKPGWYRARGKAAFLSTTTNSQQDDRVCGQTGDTSRRFRLLFWTSCCGEERRDACLSVHQRAS